MAWLTENWFWLLTFVAFVAMHMFGHGGRGRHGGHGGHGGGDRQRGADERDNDEIRSPDAKTRSGGHQH